MYVYGMCMLCFAVLFLSAAFGALFFQKYCADLFFACRYWSQGHGGYSSDTPLGGDQQHSRPPLFKSTIPKPFTFEARAKLRPKPIAAVKLEQDLELKRQEQEAIGTRRYEERGGGGCEVGHGYGWD
jgi:hypothetical protein